MFHHLPNLLEKLWHLLHRRKILVSLILLAMVIIIVPIVFEPSRGTIFKDVSWQLPPRPSIIEDNMPIADNETEKEQSQSATTVLPYQQTTAWVIKLDQYYDKVTAQSVVEKLRTFGFTAFSSKVENSQERQMQVLVGPELQQTKMQILQKALAQLQLTGKIDMFDPLAVIN